ncbi:MAG: hypothetical protein WDM89_19360 [Rhizomicrobium sp.]
MKNTFDLRGRKTSSIDSDMGTWIYATDAFGELYQQTSAVEAANHTTTALAYDALGRLVSRVEPDMSATWTYGASAANHNIDALVSTNCTGATCGPGYSRSYTFDSIGRPLQTTLSTGGINFHNITTYDVTTGKIVSVRNYSGFTQDFVYSAHGYLSSIHDDATPTLVYWAATARNASLQLTKSVAAMAPSPRTATTP